MVHEAGQVGLMLQGEVSEFSALIAVVFSTSGLLIARAQWVDHACRIGKDMSASWRSYSFVVST